MTEQKRGDIRNAPDVTHDDVQSRPAGGDVMFRSRELGPRVFETGELGSGPVDHGMVRSGPAATSPP